MSGDPALGPDSGVPGRSLEDDVLFGEAELAPVIVVLPHPPTVAGGGSWLSFLAATQDGQLPAKKSSNALRVSFTRGPLVLTFARPNKSLISSTDFRTTSCCRESISSHLVLRNSG